MSCLFYICGTGYLSYTLCIIAIFTSLFTYFAIYVVARKMMLKRNEVHSNSDRESRRNFLAFLRELNMAKTYALLVSSCFLCYLPAVVVLRIFGNILNRDRKTPDSVEYSFDWGSTLISMNSSLPLRKFHIRFHI